jgi:hypothetical protein
MMHERTILLRQLDIALKAERLARLIVRQRPDLYKRYQVLAGANPGLGIKSVWGSDPAVIGAYLMRERRRKGVSQFMADVRIELWSHPAYKEISRFLQSKYSTDASFCFMVCLVVPRKLRKGQRWSATDRQVLKKLRISPR